MLDGGQEIQEAEVQATESTEGAAVPAGFHVAKEEALQKMSGEEGEEAFRTAVADAEKAVQDGHREDAVRVMHDATAVHDQAVTGEE